MQKSNEAMQKRIEQLEAEVNSRNAQGQPSADVAMQFGPCTFRC